MSSPADNPTGPPPVRYASWFSRNWKWFVPSLAAFLALGFALFLWASIRMVNHVFRWSEVYQTAVRTAEQSPLVSERLGQPLAIGDSASGEVSSGTVGGHARLSIPISGPLGKGRIVVIAQKFGDRWVYHLIEVQVDGDPAAIVLEGSEDTVPLEPDDSAEDDSGVKLSLGRRARG